MLLANYRLAAQLRHAFVHQTICFFVITAGSAAACKCQLRSSPAHWFTIVLPEKMENSSDISAAHSVSCELPKPSLPSVPFAQQTLCHMPGPAAYLQRSCSAVASPYCPAEQQKQESKYGKCQCMMHIICRLPKQARTLKSSLKASDAESTSHGCRVQAAKPAHARARSIGNNAATCGKLIGPTCRRYAPIPAVTSKYCMKLVILE